MSAKSIWIQLNGGSPWGFRLKETADHSLVVSRVNSKGRQQGIKEGDRILSVNGQSTVNMTHAEAQRIIRESETGLELQLERIAEQIEASCFNGNGTMPSSVEVMSRLNAVDEDINHTGSWSTDSTSTGSTTIQVSSFHSDSSGSENVWSPSSKRANLRLNVSLQPSSQKTAPVEQAPPVPPQPPVGTPPPPADKAEDESSPVWQPFGAPYDGLQFRPVKLEVTRTQRTATAISQIEQPKTVEANATEVKPDPPNKPEATSNEPAHRTTEDAKENAPETGISPSTSAVFTKTGRSINLPPSQSPTITLLQKAREGQLPKGAVYIDDKPDLTPLPKNAVLIDQKVTVEGDKVHTDSYYAVPTLTTETSSYNVKAPPKYDGIGPTEYGIPVGLRTGVKEEYASDWYKTMYKSLHKQRFPNDSQKTVHLGGYMSEPEFERTDKHKEKYASDYRRMPEKSVSYSTQASSSDKSKIGIEPSVVRHEPKREAYRVEPRSIAEYEPGHSSLAEQEFHKFWSDFWDSMDDLHEHLGTSPKSQPSLNRRWPNVLLSDGYESDSTLIRKTGRSIEVDPDQQKCWYKEIQKGGEIPLTGLRKTVPEKPSASQHQYQETQVNIHYKSPIRHLEKEYIEEDELRKRQEDAMRKLYEEERKKKHKQEMAEIEMRRHGDFFTPSQKSPIPLNRYDNPFDTGYSKVTTTTLYTRSPQGKTMAKALYPFVSQTTRELSLNKGDIVYINKQIDKNWYEGEHHGLVGIFPVSYVEIIPSEKANFQPRKPMEGEAIVKYNFRAQTPMELSLFKGEKVVLTGKKDHNWYEGRLGTKKGIFPISYVEVLQETGEMLGLRSISPKPPASPVFGSLVNGSIPKPIEGPTFTTGLRHLQDKPPLNLEKIDSKSPLTQSLHIDTYNEPIPYKSLYSYAPQNEDELELKEGDTVYVMEKCDDGWYVGTSLRTGLFGTFPGNYVERI